MVDAFAVDEPKTQARCGSAAQGIWAAARKTLVIDAGAGRRAGAVARNLAGVKLVPANQVTAYDVLDCAKVIASQAALTRLQETLG